jgi:integrase
MAYTEKRGNLWRARWRDPDGTLESKPGFVDRKAALEYGRDQEAAIRNHTYVDPRKGQLTVAEWTNQWFPALDLEPATLDSYRYMIEVHILPAFGDRTLASLTTEEIATWEAGVAASGLSRRTAREARSTLANLLNDAIPRHLTTNPAARRRGKGRKGERRIARIENKRKVWTTTLQALLLAERAAVLSGRDTDFVMLVTIAYTGMRWSEAIGLPPDCVHETAVDIHWKLYELNGRFYRGRPKDGSMRTADCPAFLHRLLAAHLAAQKSHRCTCKDRSDHDGVAWCTGSEYVFLGAESNHFRRSNYSTRIMRPAADGWYPGYNGRQPRPAMPVLVDTSTAWPGRPVPPWPPALPGEPFQPPRGRGVLRHSAETPLASWRPILPELTPHGLRHGHETWMDDAGIAYVLQSERMGHEVPGMRGVYSHPTPRMRTTLVRALQNMWDEALAERAQLAPRSAVRALDAILTGRPAAPAYRLARAHPSKVDSQTAPEIGH